MVNDEVAENWILFIYLPEMKWTFMSFYFILS